MAKVVSPPVPAIKHVDGGGGANCFDCGGNLYFSWRITLVDDTYLSLCTMCLQARS